MFAQKSTELLRRIRRSASIGQSVLVINHSSDTRYLTEVTGKGAEGESRKDAEGAEGESIIVSSIITHDKDTVVSSGNITTTSSACLFDIASRYNIESYNLIVIDEGQFFSDLFDQATKWAEGANTHVIVAGLSGDSERKPFGDILRLIPHAEEIEYLSALCSVCKDGTPAYFSKAISCKTSQVDIGGADKYIPVCRKHYG
jgi:thymidine kinase